MTVPSDDFEIIDEHFLDVTALDDCVVEFPDIVDVIVTSEYQMADFGSILLMIGPI